MALIRVRHTRTTSSQEVLMIISVKSRAPPPAECGDSIQRMNIPNLQYFYAAKMHVVIKCPQKNLISWLIDHRHDGDRTVVTIDQYMINVLLQNEDTNKQTFMTSHQETLAKVVVSLGPTVILLK